MEIYYLKYIMIIHFHLLILLKLLEKFKKLSVAPLHSKCPRKKIKLIPFDENSLTHIIILSAVRE